VAAVLRSVPDHHDLRVTRLVLREGMDFKLAEKPRERDVLLAREVLSEEENDLVLEERPVNLLEGCPLEGFREIRATNLCPDARA